MVVRAAGLGMDVSNFHHSFVLAAREVNERCMWVSHKVAALRPTPTPGVSDRSWC